jgi:hypothetical protein
MVDCVFFFWLSLAMGYICAWIIHRVSRWHGSIRRWTTGGLISLLEHYLGFGLVTVSLALF